MSKAILDKFGFLLAPVYRWWLPQVEERLTRSGLMAHDIVQHYGPAWEFAMKLRKPDDIVDQERRIRRSIDLDLKHKNLPNELRDYDPFDTDFFDKMDLAEKLRDERIKLNNHIP